MKYISHTTPPGLLQKTTAIVTTAALLGLGLMFSAVLLTVIVTIGAAAWFYLWWKTRGLRKQMQAQMQDFPPRGAAMESEVFHGEVIEGEAVRVDEPEDGQKR